MIVLHNVQWLDDECYKVSVRIRAVGSAGEIEVAQEMTYWAEEAEM